MRPKTTFIALLLSIFVFSGVFVSTAKAQDIGFTVNIFEVDRNKCLGLTNIPPELRTVPVVVNGTQSSKTFDFDKLDIKPSYAMAYRVGANFGFGRFSLNFGGKFAFHGGGDESESQQWAMFVDDTSQGSKPLLAEYSVIRRTFTPSIFGEAQLDVTSKFSVLAGYSYTSSGYSVVTYKPSYTAIRGGIIYPVESEKKQINSDRVLTGGPYFGFKVHVYSDEGYDNFGEKHPARNRLSFVMTVGQSESATVKFDMPDKPGTSYSANAKKFGYLGVSLEYSFRNRR